MNRPHSLQHPLRFERTPSAFPGCHMRAKLCWRFHRIDRIDTGFSFQRPQTSIACSVPAMRARCSAEAIPMAPLPPPYSHLATHPPTPPPPILTPHPPVPAYKSAPHPPPGVAKTHLQRSPEAEFDVAMSLSEIGFSCPFVCQ